MGAGLATAAQETVRMVRRVAAMILGGAYLAGLLPVGLLGLIANADYRFRDCPGAMQCDDAAALRTLALDYAIAAPIVALAVLVLLIAARPSPSGPG